MQLSLSSDSQMPPSSELASFGIDREFEYTGHITLATHLVPLPRRTYASTDETHIRIWGPSGDVAKTNFPANRRSMVSAMAYCSTFSAVLTAEVDMTMKAYFIQTLDMLDSFPLNEKVSAMTYLPQHSWVLIGGENGCDLWQLSKSNRRRSGGSLGRLEHHLQLALVRRVSAGSVLNIVADMAEHRVIMWGPKSLSIYDTELNLITSYMQPHTEPMRCACIQILSILDTALLTGGEDGNVNFWSIQGKQSEGVFALDDFMNDTILPAASMRLEHSFRGHSRTVEMVCFYHRKQTGQTQSLCVSYARDGKMKVWSLIQFSIVYTLDLYFLDSKVFIFPLANHAFAVSAAASGGSQSGGGQQRTILTLMRFTAHIACPFATTNQSPVVLINRPLLPPSFQLSTEDTHIPALRGVVTLVSEDVAVRIVDADAQRLVATLPPPPNSKVQVLRVFIVPLWQLLILWLSSQEIAIFFIPSAGPNKSSRKEAEGEGTSKRATKSTTPLLIRRFSILEVVAHSFDKDLHKEAFRTVCLHRGCAPPKVDGLTKSSFAVTEPEVPEDNNADSDSDWFLMIGTFSGTIQAFRLRDILVASPIWSRIVRHLPQGSWQDMRCSHGYGRGAAVNNAASDIEQVRLDTFESELADAIESARIAGQRPFPRDAPKLRFFGRWKCHEYFIEVAESVVNMMLTWDMKHNLRLWNVATMECIFTHQLEPFACYAPYLQPLGFVSPDKSSAQRGFTRQSLQSSQNSDDALQRSTLSGLAASPDDILGFAGLALGSKTGNLSLMLMPNSHNSEPDLLTSLASHQKEILQIDFIWPINVFATIGADDTLKIWSHGLIVLREIGFPQPLTAIAFRHRDDLDAAQGHGDIFVGFACHVESLSFDYWSHGVDIALIGREAVRGRSEQTRALYFSNRGHSLLDASDDIEEHSRWLHADDPLAAREYNSQRKGVKMQGAVHVALFKNALMKSLDKVNALPSEREEAKAQKDRLRQGEVTDFRGPPLIEIETLSGQAVDNDVLGLPSRPSQEPTMHHKRTNHHNQGDFAECTHTQQGYYDEYVHPSYIVDAPRVHAIRGGVDGTETAMVTSIGSRIVGPPEDAPPGGMPTTSTTRRSTVKAGGASGTSAQAGQSSPRRQASQATAGAGGTGFERGDCDDVGRSTAEETRKRATTVSTTDGAQQEKQSGPGDEPWRSRRIARGVPKDDMNKPRQQDVANSDLDTARLLESRGHMEEVPDIPDENQLKRMMAKKAEWLYSPKDSLVLSSKRQSIQQMEVRQAKSQVWTLAGRLVCDPGSRPPSSSVSIATSPPPHLLKQRIPVTRSEVTEQRIIESASMPPPRAPQFSIEAKAPRSVQTTRPLSARARGASGQNPTYQSKVPAETSRAPPLSAR